MEGEEGKSVASTTVETQIPTPSDSSQTLPSDPSPLPPAPLATPAPSAAAAPLATPAPSAAAAPLATPAPSAAAAPLPPSDAATTPAAAAAPAATAAAPPTPSDHAAPPTTAAPSDPAAAPSATAAAIPAAAAIQSKKRKFEDVNLHNSTYFKIRAVVKDLRPFFIEVLQTPDLRKCKAATEIRKKMKVMMDLYKQITRETVSIAKCKNTCDSQPLLDETKDKLDEAKDKQKPVEKRQVEKRAEHHKADKLVEKSSGGKHPPGGNSHKVEDARTTQGTYVVGGSPCGWNFIMYPASKTVYYGVTKESRQIAK